MMRTTILAAAALFANVPSVGAQPALQAAGAPAVQVGVFGTRADGSRSGGAFDTEPKVESTVYTAQCTMGARNSDPPANAEYAWRFAASVVEKTPTQATIQLRWRRIVDAGQAVKGDDQSLQLTLAPDEAVELDSVVPGAECAIASFAFGVRYRATPFTLRDIRGGGRSEGSGGVARAGAASGGGAGGGAGSGAGSGIGSGGARSGQNAGPVNTIEFRPRPVEKANKPDGRPVSGRMFDVDLWLVHRIPGREERVLHQVLRGPQAGADFTFAPVAVDVARGTAMVQIGGTLSASGDNRFTVVTHRRVTYPQQPPRDTDRGRGQMTNTMPEPGEVLSVALPPIRTASGDGTLPDRFEIRVRFNE